MDLDGLQEKFGGISSYQIVVIICISVLPFGTSFMSQSAAFFSAVPQFRCRISPLDNATLYPQLTSDEITRFMMPEGESCSRYDFDLSACTGNGSLSCTAKSTNRTIPCDSGFVYDQTYYEKTTVTEWDLVCGRATLDSVAISLYFLGMLLGSAIVGPLMDWFGRKITMFATGVGVLVAGVAVAFSPSYEAYIVLRILVGMTAVPCYVVYFTYVSEMSNTKWRVLTITYATQVTALSHAVLPILGMLIRDWRYLALCVSLSILPTLAAFFFIPESPRWLIGKGRIDEARKVVEKYAKSRNKLLEDDDWLTVVAAECDKTKEANNSGTKYTLLDLFRPPLMRAVSFNVIYLWCTISMVYYGLVLNVWRLSGNPHTNGILNGSVEVLAHFVFWVMVRSIGTKFSCSLSILSAGTCCLTTMFLNLFSYGNEDMTEAARWIAITGKFFVSIAFSVIYQYTTELYPTLARGTAMGMGSMTARVGTIILPFTLQLQQSIPWLTQTTFGVMGILGGLSCLLLPDTSNVDLLSTFEQAESFYQRKMWISAFIPRRNQPSNERSLPLASLEKGGENAEFRKCDEKLPLNPYQDAVGMISESSACKM